MNPSYCRTQYCVLKSKLTYCTILLHNIPTIDCRRRQQIPLLSRSVAMSLIYTSQTSRHNVSGISHVSFLSVFCVFCNSDADANDQLLVVFPRNYVHSCTSEERPTRSRSLLFSKGMFDGKYISRHNYQFFSLLCLVEIYLTHIFAVGRVGS